MSTTIHRRDFARLGLALGAGGWKLFGATTGIEDALRAGIDKHKIPALTAIVANG